MDFPTVYHQKSVRNVVGKLALSSSSLFGLLKFLGIISEDQ